MDFYLQTTKTTYWVHDDQELIPLAAKSKRGCGCEYDEVINISNFVSLKAHESLSKVNLEHFNNVLPW
jgi:hypothetical protein